jgi:2-methylisocitrate lyase-like PEP mutase family enzyme
VSAGGERLRRIIADNECVMGAPIFDPLSARMAEMRGWDVCKLPGTMWKTAELAQPDDLALANMTDLVDISRRILRVADVILIVDADDGGGTAINVLRTVRELEGVGVAAIEIEDNRVPTYYGQAQERHDLIVSQAEQVGKLHAAVDARRDDSTVIVARTRSLRDLPLDSALERIAAYSQTGVDAIMLPGLHSPRNAREDIEAARSVTGLPIFALGMPWGLQQDLGFLKENKVVLRYVKDFPAFRMAIKGIDDCFAHLQAGGNPEDLESKMAPMELVRHTPQAISRAGEFRNWSLKYGPGADG